MKWQDGPRPSSARCSRTSIHMQFDILSECRKGVKHGWWCTFCFWLYMNNHGNGQPAYHTGKKGQDTFISLLGYRYRPGREATQLWSFCMMTCTLWAIKGSSSEAVLRCWKHENWTDQ
ncbi:hypothetical protein TNCV_3832111 [Trichonephila clavipes]|nr:hypothetical protein TNCV_3832111 [Trichonephila clavipes]